MRSITPLRTHLIRRSNIQGRRSPSTYRPTRPLPRINRRPSRPSEEGVEGAATARPQLARKA